MATHSSTPGEGGLSKLPVIAIVDDDESFRRATMSSFGLLDTLCSSLHPLKRS
jgi:hypothetical protein